MTATGYNNEQLLIVAFLCETKYYLQRSEVFTQWDGLLMSLWSKKSICIDATVKEKYKKSCKLEEI